MKYICELCGYVYDEAAGEPKRGIAPGTSFHDLSEEFDCPGCGYEKEAFNPVRHVKDTQLKTQSHTRLAVRR